MTLDARARRASQGIQRAVEVIESSGSTEGPEVQRFDRFMARKARNRRIGAIVVVAAMAISALVVVGGGVLDRGQGTVPADSHEIPSSPPVFEQQIGTATLTEDECSTDSAIGQGHLDGLMLVNRTDGLASFELAKFVSSDLSYAELEAYVARDRDRAEAGRPALELPEGIEVTVRAEMQPGVSSTIDEPIPPGRYAIVCLRPYAQVSALRPFALVGPVVFE